MWASLKCDIDPQICLAEPKTTRWSLCFGCVLAYANLQKFDAYNLETFPRAEKIDLIAFRFNFVPQLVLSFFKKLDAITFCCSPMGIIDTNFLPENSDNLINLQVDRNFIRRIEGNVFKSARNMRILQLDQNQIQDMDIDAFDGLRSLKLLNVSTNRIRTLNRALFDDLFNLEQLVLDDNLIESFEAGTFKNLGKLEKLSAQVNTINSVSKNDFSGLRSIRELKLNGNRITKLDAGTFSEMPKLKILELNDNLIKNIHGNAFRGTINLEKISLENNQLKRLAGKTVSQLTNLRELNVLNNICVNQSFGNLQAAVNQLQLTCDPKPNDCLVPNIINGWISMVESLQNVTIGSYYDDFELVEVQCEPGYSLLLEKTLDNLVACIADGNSSTWNKDFLQCQSKFKKIV